MYNKFVVIPKCNKNEGVDVLMIKIKPLGDAALEIIMELWLVDHPVTSTFVLEKLKSAKSGHYQP